VEASEHERLLEEHRAAAGVVGAAAGMLIGDQLITACAGNASLDPLLNVVPETRFHIVSVTKTLVATVLARLRGKDRISFDDPVAKHVPEVQVAKWSETRHASSPLGEHRGSPTKGSRGTRNTKPMRSAAHVASRIPLGVHESCVELARPSDRDDDRPHVRRGDAREAFAPIGMTSTGFAHEGGSEPASRARST
jgi:hypothetical protein